MQVGPTPGGNHTGGKGAQVMAVGLEAVIANHLESQTAVVLEGDFIHPSLAAQKSFADLANDGRVRAIFLYEAEERQLAAHKVLVSR